MEPRPDPFEPKPTRWKLPRFRLGWANTAMIGIGFAGELWRWYEREGGLDWSGWTASCGQLQGPGPCGIWVRARSSSTVEGAMQQCGIGYQALGDGISWTPGQDIPVAPLGSPVRNVIILGARLLVGGDCEIPGGRFNQDEVHYWPGPARPAVPWIPGEIVVAPPPLLPQMPPYRALPRARPDRTPRQDRPQYRRPPQPYPGGSPSIDVEPGAAPKPGIHEERPPEPGEKEKKGRFRNSSTQAAWMRHLDSNIGRITEADDLVSAIYKGLPWQMRRWKGRDGVWRDRHYQTHTRAAFIAANLSSLNIIEAAKQIMREQAIDAAGAAVGRLGQRALERAGHYRGLQGLQAGQRFTKRTWDDALQSLREGAAAANTPKDYYVWKFLDVGGNPVPPTRIGGKLVGGKWYKQLVKGSRQVIPWLQNTKVENRNTKVFRGTAEWWQYAFQRDESILLREERNYGYMQRPTHRRWYSQYR